VGVPASVLAIGVFAVGLEVSAGGLEVSAGGSEVFAAGLASSRVQAVVSSNPAEK